MEDSVRGPMVIFWCASWFVVKSYYAHAPRVKIAGARLYITSQQEVLAMDSLDLKHVWLWCIASGVIVLVVGALLAYVFWFSFSVHLPIAVTTSEWGQFGDYVGGVVGTALSAATVALLVLSILIQRETYSTTKAELKATSEALADQLKQSHERSALDNFQSTLELMLSHSSGRAGLKDLGAAIVTKLSRGDATDAASWHGAHSIVEKQFGMLRGFLSPLLKLVHRLGEIAIEEAGSKRRSLIATLSACLDDAEILGLRILVHFDVPDARLSALINDPAFQMSKDNEANFALIISKFSKPGGARASVIAGERG
jgi:hypothetical protein